MGVLVLVAKVFRDNSITSDWWTITFLPLEFYMAPHYSRDGWVSLSRALLSLGAYKILPSPFMTPFTTKTLAVRPPAMRGATVLKIEDLARLQERRSEVSYTYFLVKSGPHCPAGVPHCLVYEGMDGTVHHPVIGSNHLPTLIPKFLSNVPLRKLSSISCDQRPDGRLMMRHYLAESKTHFGSLLAEAAAAQGKLPKTCKHSLCIPCASKDEAEFIGRTLRTIARQTAPKDSFEVVVFLNCLSEDGRVDDASRHTIAALESAMREHPELQVRPFFAALPRGELWTIGRIRKLLFDSVCLRVFERDPKNTGHLLTTLDADLAGLHPGFVEHFLGLFQTRPHLDAARAHVDWDWKSLAQDPLLLFSIRLNMFFDAHRRMSDHTYGVGTPGFTIRADRYVDAGGYHHLDRVGEDMGLMQRVKNIRVGSTSNIGLIRAGPPSRGWYSTRRAERALEIDLTPPVNQWFVDGARFQEEDPLVRKVTSQQRPSFIEQLDSPNFMARAETVLLRSLQAYAQEAQDKTMSPSDLACILDRLSGLGIQLSPDGLKATINNTARLRTLLLTFVEHSRSHWTNALGLEW